MVTFDGVTEAVWGHIGDSSEYFLNYKQITFLLKNPQPFAVQIEDVLQHQILTF